MQHGRDAGVLHHEAPGQLAGICADAAAVVGLKVVAVGGVVVRRQAVAVVDGLRCTTPGRQSALQSQVWSLKAGACSFEALPSTLLSGGGMRAWCLTCVQGVGGAVGGAVVVGLVGLVLQGLMLAGLGLHVAPGPGRLGARGGAGAVERRCLIGLAVGEVPAACVEE